MLEFKPIVFNLFMKPLEKKTLSKMRNEIISNAYGHVLEIGAGTGVNFNFYIKDNLKMLRVLDLKFNNIIRKHKLNNEIHIDYIIGSAENLPFQDNSFDCVVSTLTFCSIENNEKALKEVYRILKTNGKLLFIEHVLPEKEPYKTRINKMNGIWKAIGKCNLNRETDKLIKKVGFKIEELERYGKGSLVFVKGIAVKQ